MIHAALKSNNLCLPCQPSPMKADLSAFSCMEKQNPSFEINKAKAPIKCSAI